MSAKYRKRSVEVEARQLTPDSVEEIVAWVGDCAYWAPPYHGFRRPSGPAVFLPISGGEQRAYEGDWIIKDAEDDYFYVCKPDIFGAMYEPA